MTRFQRLMHFARLAARAAATLTVFASGYVAAQDGVRVGREMLGTPDQQNPALVRSAAHGNRYDEVHQTPTTEYTPDEIIAAGHHFFGTVSGGLASAIERSISANKLPNGYILGEEGAAAFVGGVRYGEGILYTRNAGEHKVYWQGPSVGFDFGGNGSRVMMLVYDLPSVETMYNRYVGLGGSAFAVGGVGVQAMGFGNTLVLPVRSGVGARLGIRMGYVKFTRSATWNPF